MDEEYNPVEVEKENLGDAVHFISDGMTEQCEATFYDGKAISIELPVTIIAYRGLHRALCSWRHLWQSDEIGEAGKRLRTAVADFIKIGEAIEIDSRTGEFKCRAKV